MKVRGRIAYAGSLLKSITFPKLLNFLKLEFGYQLSRITHKPIMLGLPWAASIEPTNNCNLRCPQCPTGMQVITRKQGFLELDSFRHFIDKLTTSLIHLTLYFQGEPFMNRQFIEMIREARSRKIFVTTSTNGHFLDKETAQDIVDSGLNHLVISLDGLDQETYANYRIHGKLRKVKEGIENLVLAKKEKNSLLPLIELQFLVMGHNEHQISEAKLFARKSGADFITFKSAQVYTFEKEDSILPKQSRYSRYQKNSDGKWVIRKKLKNSCHRIWRSCVVTWEGEVVPCCYDKDASYSAGNLNSNSLKEIWNSDQMQDFRKKVFRNRSGIDICANCGE